MRWTRLFDDFEAQLHEASRLELEEEITERIRAERRSLRLVDRLRVATGHRLEVRVLGVGTVHGVLRQVGADWLLLAEDTGSELLVPMASVLSMANTGAKAALALGGEGIRWTMDVRHALSVISRDRSHVLVTLTDGSVAAGLVDVVGADFVEVTPRVPGEHRDRAAGVPISIPLLGIGLVRRPSS